MVVYLNEVASLLFYVYHLADGNGCAVALELN